MSCLICVAGMLSNWCLTTHVLEHRYFNQLPTGFSELCAYLTKSNVGDDYFLEGGTYTVALPTSIVLYAPNP